MLVYKVGKKVGNITSIGVTVSPTTHFAATFVWWLEKGVVHGLFVDSTPKHPKSESSPEVQPKCPGGRSDENETTEITALRELKQETGLSVKRKIKLISVYRPRAKNGHLKEGFIIPRSGCRGALRTTPLIDTMSTLSVPYAISLDEALKKVFHNDRNKFHLNFLLSVRDYFVQKFGEESVGPAQA